MKGRVFYGKIEVGVLWKDADGYGFAYLPKYLESENAEPIAYTLPLRKKEYQSEALFPFFQNLASEGWLLSVQSRLQKIDREDTFTLLLKNGRDLIGAVSIIPQEEGKGKRK